MKMMNDFLPINEKDMHDRGWECADIVLISGDAYVDHPSFGTAIISRVLEAGGYKVAVLPQPDLKNDFDFTQFGRPKLGFFITSGNLDSMVAHYTSAKRIRSDDAYSAGGKSGKRPDRAVIVYCRKVRELFGDIPIIIGGLEASLRRFAHYDYWDDIVRPSILFDSSADIIVYGMGEKQALEISNRLLSGDKINDITNIKGTCFSVDVRNTPLTGTECPSFENVKSNKKEYAISCRIQHDEQDFVRGKLIKQRHGSRMLIQNPPMTPLTTNELDEIYALPYMRACHPTYKNQGGVPAIEEVEYSITHNRGCFGDCNFCSISFHQGRFVTSRSKLSILDEAKLLINSPGFKGYINDIGGPTANFRKASCERQLKNGHCIGKKCLAPEPCPLLKVDHSEYLDILKSVRELPGVKKVFIRSGIRYDYMMTDKEDNFFIELVKNHVSGQLKVAPEHCSAAVLDCMGKPHIEMYLKFSKKYFDLCKKYGKEQYLVPYLISSHPGSTLKDAVDLAVFLKKEKIKPRQVQDFYPTPGTISTCMYYTGLDPYTLKEVYCAHTVHDKALQRALLQYFIPANKKLVEEALRKTGRRDLIGNNAKCLISSCNKSNVYSNIKRVDNYSKYKK